MRDDLDQYALDCVKIEPLALEEEFVRLPSDLAYWNNRYAEVYRYWQERKHIKETMAHTLGAFFREQLSVTSKGRVTVAEVEEQVTLSEDFKQARAKELHGEVEKIRVQGVCEALRAKKDMLVSLGAHMRAEMGDMTMRGPRNAINEQRRAADEFGTKS